MLLQRSEPHRRAEYSSIAAWQFSTYAGLNQAGSGLRMCVTMRFDTSAIHDNGALHPLLLRSLTKTERFANKPSRHTSYTSKDHAFCQGGLRHAGRPLL